MWHFILKRSNIDSEMLIDWVKSLEKKSIVEKLSSQGWYLPLNNVISQSQYKSYIDVFSGPSQECWDNSWSFPRLNNAQKVNLEKIWNQSSTP